MLHFCVKRSGLFGLFRSILERWSKSVADHHITVIHISELCDFDSAFICMNLPSCRQWVLQPALWSVVSVHPSPTHWAVLHSFILMDCFCCSYSFFLSCSSFCGADQGLLWAVGQIGGPSAHSAGLWHMWTIHH